MDKGLTGCPDCGWKAPVNVRPHGFILQIDYDCPECGYQFSLVPESRLEQLALTP